MDNVGLLEHISDPRLWKKLQVTGVKFPLDHNTQLPKPHCYVDFIDQASLDEAIAKNGQVK
jgi:RNA recognition motif. (a.k.a. RRM, RBD, or RNP domain)